MDQKKGYLGTNWLKLVAEEDMFSSENYEDWAIINNLLVLIY